MTAYANEESAIRAVIETWASAMRAKDAEGVASQYAADNVKFTLAPPLQYAKDHPFDKNSLDKWFATFQGSIDYENRDLNITAGNDVAFCHSLNRMMATTTKGEKVDLWFRDTLGFRKITASGRSRMNTAPCPSTWTAASKPQSTSNRNAVPTFHNGLNVLNVAQRLNDLNGIF